MRALAFAKRNLWPTDFELALVPRWDSDLHHAYMLSYLSGARQRIGYSERVTKSKAIWNRGIDQLLTVAVPGDGVMHEVERNLALLEIAKIDCRSSQLEVWLTEEDRGFADRFLEGRQNNDRVALGIGAGHPRRKWPIERFLEVGRMLAEQNKEILVVGGEAEFQAGEQLRHRLGDVVLNSAGLGTLRQTAALLERCQSFIGNDSGPMHLAAAAGLPGVEVSVHPETGAPEAEESPNRFGPWGIPAEIVRPHVPTQPCSDRCSALEPHCILNVRVEDLMRAFDQVMKRQVENKWVHELGS